MRNKLLLIIMLSSLCLYTQEYPKHSAGVDFGTTLFSTVTLPLVFDNIYKPKEGAAGKKVDGKYGIRLTYNYAYLPNQALDISIGAYGFDTHYGDNEPVKNDLGEIISSGISKEMQNGSIFAIPASLGVRFYFNKENKPNGFFLLPKLGFTAMIINAKNINENNNISYKTTSVTDFYIAGELGWKIDLFQNNDWPVAPFIDISLLDVGYSFTHFIRFVPLPRFAVGLYF